MLETLGAGGFGQVYRAVSVETGQEYACKSIPKLQAGASHVTPHHLLRIRGEVDAMSQLGASLDATALKVSTLWMPITVSQCHAAAGRRGQQCLPAELSFVLYLQHIKCALLAAVRRVTNPEHLHADCQS